MAITHEFPGITITVCVDGVPLKEHATQTGEKGDRLTACFIEATTGKNFTVKCEVAQGTCFLGDAISFLVTADGHYHDGQLIQKKQCQTSTASIMIEGFRMTKDTVAAFCFSPLKIISDLTYHARELYNIKDLSAIEVKVLHEHLGKKTRTDRRPLPESISKVTEKAVEGRDYTHSVKFGKIITSPSTAFETTPVDGDDKPAAKFVFWYRSTDALKSMNIIPDTPSPTPLEDREPGSLTEAEITELQLRCKQKRTDEDVASDGIEIFAGETASSGDSSAVLVSDPEDDNTDIAIDDDVNAEEDNDDADDDDDEWSGVFTPTSAGSRRHSDSIDVA